MKMAIKICFNQTWSNSFITSVNIFLIFFPMTSILISKSRCFQVIILRIRQLSVKILFLFGSGYCIPITVFFQILEIIANVFLVSLWSLFKMKKSLIDSWVALLIASYNIFRNPLMIWILDTSSLNILSLCTETHTVISADKAQCKKTCMMQHLFRSKSILSSN